MDAAWNFNSRQSARKTKSRGWSLTKKTNTCWRRCCKLWSDRKSQPKHLFKPETKEYWPHFTI